MNDGAQRQCDTYQISPEPVDHGTKTEPCPCRAQSRWVKCPLSNIGAEPCLVGLVYSLVNPPDHVIHRLGTLCSHNTVRTEVHVSNHFFFLSRWSVLLVFGDGGARGARCDGDGVDDLRADLIDHVGRYDQPSATAARSVCITRHAQDREEGRIHILGDNPEDN